MTRRRRVLAAVAAAVALGALAWLLSWAGHTCGMHATISGPASAVTANRCP